MIIQLFTPALQTRSVIPFETGYYTVKIIRIDIRLGNSNTANSIILISDKLKFSPTSYNIVGGFTINTNGILFGVRGTPGLRHGFDNNIFDGSDDPIIFYNVFLDGFIDTRWSNSGIPNAYLTQPPGLTDGVNRVLMTLDIEKSNNYLLNPYNKINMPFYIQCFSTYGAGGRNVNTALPFYGVADIRITRIDTIIHSSPPYFQMDTFYLTSNTLRNYGGQFITFINDPSQTTTALNFFTLSDYYGKSMIYKNVPLNGYIDFSIRRWSGVALGNLNVIITLEITQK